MRTSRLPLTLLLATAALLAVLMLSPAAAEAARGERVIDDCAENGRLTGSYTDADLRDALRKLPADLDEYTDCRELIERARRTLARRSSGNGSSGGSAFDFGSGGGFGGFGGFDGFDFDSPFTDDEFDRLDGLTGGDFGSVELDGRQVAPGKPGGVFGQAAAASNDIPLPLLLLMITVFAAAAALTAARGRVPEPVRRAAAPLGRAAAPLAPVGQRVSGAAGRARDTVTRLIRRG